MFTTFADMELWPNTLQKFTGRYILTLDNVKINYTTAANGPVLHKFITPTTISTEKLNKQPGNNSLTQHRTMKQTQTQQIVMSKDFWTLP